MVAISHTSYIHFARGISYFPTQQSHRSHENAASSPTKFRLAHHLGRCPPLCIPLSCLSANKIRDKEILRPVATFTDPGQNLGRYVARLHHQSYGISRPYSYFGCSGPVFKGGSFRCPSNPAHSSSGRCSFRGHGLQTPWFSPEFSLRQGCSFP